MKSEWRYVIPGGNTWKRFVDNESTHIIVCHPDATFNLFSVDEADFSSLIGNYPDFPTAAAVVEKMEADRERERQLDEPGTFYVVDITDTPSWGTLRRAEVRAANLGRMYQNSSRFVVVTPVKQ